MRVIWAIICAGLLSAAPPDPWLRVRSANFELFTTAGERDGRELVRHFEQFRSFFLSAFGSQPSAGRPVEIIVFRSDKEFDAYRPNQLAAAFFQPGISHDFIVMKNASGANDPVAVHEYTHLLVRQTNSPIPVWLNEGLAELYSNLEASGSQVTVGQPIPGRVQALRRENWLRLDDLLSVTENSPLYQEKSRAGMFYAESWILVHMLVLDPAYRLKLQAMLAALRSGSSIQAFPAVYGRSLEQIEHDLRSYASNASLAAAVFDAPQLDSVTEPAVERTAGLPARLALAELLTVTPGRTAAARAAYQQLARDYPNRWEIEQAEGEFCLRERRSSEAAEHFAIAGELGGKNPRMFLDYARALTLTNRGDQAVSALETALRLDPGLDEAHFELGLAQVRAGSYPEALEEFHKIRKLAPEFAARYYYSLAYAHYRMGDRERARALVREARTYTRNPDELVRLNALEQALTKK